MKFRLSIAPFLLVSIALVQSAKAEDSPGSGFFLRSTLGAGHSWSHAEQTEAQSDLGMQAWMGGVMFSPGYQFFSGLVLHGDVYGAMHFAHKLRVDADTNLYSPEQVGLMEFIVGAGLTYQPSVDGLFVSGGLGFSEVWGSRWQLSDSPDGAPDTKTAASYPGYAAYASVGQLFHAHKRWSAGPRLNYNFKHVGRPEESDLTFGRVHTLWLGLSCVFQPVGKPESGDSR